MNEHNRLMAVSPKGIVFIVLMLIIGSLFACSFDGEYPSVEESNMTPDYQMTYTEPEQETLPPIRQEMPSYEFSYSGELEDVIVLEQQAEENNLVFYVVLSSGRFPIFALCFNTDEGDFVTVLSDASGNSVPVAFQMEAIPDGLNEEDKTLFFVAQDAVNEIAESLVLK